MDTVVIIVILLLIFGVCSLCVELTMCGFGVFGVSGILMLAAAGTLTVMALPFGIYLLILEIIVISAFMTCFFRYIKKKQLYGKLILDEHLAYEAKDIAGLDYFLGKTGVTKIPLRPLGEADFNGNVLDVWSEGAYVGRGKKIKVVKVDGGKLIVRELNEEV